MAEYVCVNGDVGQIFHVLPPYLYRAPVGDANNCVAGGGCYHRISTQNFNNMTQHMTIVG